MKINRVLRHTALLLAFSMFSQTIAFAKKLPDDAVIREKVAAIGQGKQCRVKLVDGTQVKGKIVSIDTDNLTVKPEGIVELQRIDYAQISAIQKSGLSDKAKRRIGIAVGVGVTCVLLGLLGQALGT